MIRNDRTDFGIELCKASNPLLAPLVHVLDLKWMRTKPVEAALAGSSRIPET
jgi:hypothetical protein